MKRFLSICLLFWVVVTSVSARDFTVVIDAGHGGKDPGAVGKRGNEKDVNLSVALEVGRLIKANMNDVKVVYTRSKDVFVQLQDRSAIANKANGDLFICIHVNASKSRAACGAETYTIGLGKSDANFEVAKRENSVILLEDGYKERYQGFDPQSPESYIMFEFMQSKFSDQSIEMAAYTQDEFVAKKRYNRGVRQENFWVLHQTKMPSVLIELGFISNPDEEKYLLSESGQKELSMAIFKAFERYKHEYDRKNRVTMVELPNEQQQPENQNFANETIDDKTQVVYKLQIFSTSQKIANTSDARFKGFACDCYEENGLFKYTYGAKSTLEEIQKLKSDVKKEFPQAFIVAFYQGKKITLSEAKSLTKK